MTNKVERVGQNVRQALLVVAFGAVAFFAGRLIAAECTTVAQRWSDYRAEKKLRQVLADQWSVLATTGAQLGAGGKATLVEFSDYQCPFCRRTDVALDSALTQGKIRVAFHHFPLVAIHPAAEGAARAAICAEHQGHFREMHHYLMTATDWQTDTDWVRVATNTGVPNRAAFAECLQSRSTSERLAADRKLANLLNVNATPSFFTPQRVYVGALTAKQIAAIAGSGVVHTAVR